MIERRLDEVALVVVALIVFLFDVGVGRCAANPVGEDDLWFVPEVVFGGVFGAGFRGGEEGVDENGEDEGS